MLEICVKCAITSIYIILTKQMIGILLIFNYYYAFYYILEAFLYINTGFHTHNKLCKISVMQSAPRAISAWSTFSRICAFTIIDCSKQGKKKRSFKKLFNFFLKEKKKYCLEYYCYIKSLRNIILYNNSLSISL